MSDNGPIAGVFSSTTAQFAGLILSTALMATPSLAGEGDAPERPSYHDLCIGFVIDGSESTVPHGFAGQVKGIQAGLKDPAVASRLDASANWGGTQAFAVVFSGQSKILYPPTDISDVSNRKTMANDLAVQTRPGDIGSNNNLLSGLELARLTFQAIEAEGTQCLKKIIDFSGDGADVFNAPDVIKAYVNDMGIQDGITIHGFSFNDLRWGKYTTPFTSVGMGFDDLHGYYEEVIVSNTGFNHGFHVTLATTPEQPEDFEQAVIDLMRQKIIDEIAFDRTGDDGLSPG